MYDLNSHITFSANSIVAREPNYITLYCSPSHVKVSTDDFIETYRDTFTFYMFDIRKNRLFMYCPIDIRDKCKKYVELYCDFLQSHHMSNIAAKITYMYDYIVKTNRDADAWCYNLDTGLIDSYQIKYFLKRDGTENEQVLHNIKYYHEYDTEGRPQLQRGARMGDSFINKLCVKIIYKDGKTTIT